MWDFLTETRSHDGSLLGYLALIALCIVLYELGKWTLGKIEMNWIDRRTRHLQSIEEQDDYAKSYDEGPDYTITASSARWESIIFWLELPPQHRLMSCWLRNEIARQQDSEAA